MRIASLKIMLVIGGWFINRKSFKRYCYFCIIAESILYLFFNPVLETRTYDLARYYEQLDFYKSLSFSELFSPSALLIGNKLFHIQLENYPLYAIYMFVFSRIGFNKLLPFTTDIICRSLELSSIFEIFHYKKITLSSQQRICFLAVFILMHNTITAGGIRNPLAISLCLWALIHDLVLNKHKKLCIVCYICACLIHSMAYTVVVVRVLVLMSNRLLKRSFYIWTVLIIGILTIVNSYPDLIIAVGNALHLPSGIMFSLFKTTEYRRDLSRYPVWQLFMYSYTYLTVWLVARKQVGYGQNEEMRNLYKYLTLYLIIILLNMSVTSLVGRARLVFYVLFAVFLLPSLTRSVGDKAGIFLLNRGSLLRDINLLVLSASSVLLIFAFDTYATYMTMERYIHF